MRHDLHWLDMTDRVQFRIATTVYRCLHGMAPEYLSELCFPPVKLSTYGPRSFAVAGPTILEQLTRISA